MHIEVFGAGKQWYWHFKNKGRIVADAEEFPTKSHAIRGAKGVVRAVCKNLSYHMLPIWYPIVFDKKQNIYVLKWK